MKTFILNILFLSICIIAKGQFVSKNNSESWCTDTHSIECKSYQYNQFQDSVVSDMFFSVIEIGNKTDEIGFVFFDPKICDESYSVTDFLRDRFFKSENMTLYQAILDGNVVAQMDIYGTFMKRMKAGSKFYIVINCDSITAVILCKQIRFVTMKEMSQIKRLEVLESIVSCFFSVPDIFYLDSSLLSNNMGNNH